MNHLQTLTGGMPCSLLDCPPGLFIFGIEKENPIIGFKTEYGCNNPHDMEVYCVESGETFWGGTSSKTDLANLEVVPVNFELMEI